MSIKEKKSVAYEKAIRALAGYKFWMFGYHASQWVLLNSLGKREPNPFKAFVDLARKKGARNEH